uniref:BCL2/adenovirus E1B 19 kDa protein-interacting protein 3-like n=1 Tax=Sinocyclocheilus grahami TaxID=75366 RepID=A0A672KJW0_SINGR
MLFICPSGSWVELEGLVASASQTEAEPEAQDTTASFLQGELERILLEAQLECERSSQTESPPQVLTPRTSVSPKPASEGSSSTDCVTIQSDENDRRVSAEWVWDWSNLPFIHVFLNHVSHSVHLLNYVASLDWKTFGIDNDKEE